MASITANQYRTHTNGELTRSDVGKKVRLSGWVHTRRDHGGLIFIDLRDRWGITQITFNPTKNKEAWATAEKLRDEYVIQVEGVVALRPTAMVNKKIDTGEIEVEADGLQILSTATTPPFPLNEAEEVNEEVRLKYRFLDLRRARLQHILQRRDQFIAAIRGYMHRHNFIEVQTPILANSSPEGARDYLVPSRLHPGQFYALPQAPQQFKQLLMVAGLDRYFQIAPCFRDEDPRADRHPGEFYQLDMEMSFVTQEDIFAIMEPLWVEMTEKFSNKKVMATPFPRIPWREAMTKYGTDKPDLRFDFFITDVSDALPETSFKVFAEALKKKGVIHALHVEGGATLSRQDIEELTQKAKELGAQGLAYILLKDKPTSPIIKFLGEETTQVIIKKVGAKKGDAIFFSAGQWLTVSKSLGAVRSSAAERLNKKDPTKAAWGWIVDFPMYEWNEEENKIDFSHNPFSMPQGGLKALAAKDPTTILAYQYDTVLNGYEVSSGAIRDHQPEVMYKAFAIAGYSKEEVDQKFGGMIRAFQYGAPPHGGNAPGIDRLMMVLWDMENIRDIYAFPKNGRAQDVLMGAPSPVSPKQLQDLHIKLDLEE
jgi:aspartyl-tRNA synthetase